MKMSVADAPYDLSMEELVEQSSAQADAVERLKVIDTRRRLDDLTRLVSDWVWETDEDLKLTFVSARVFEMLGYHPSELEGRRIVELGTFVDRDGEAIDIKWRSPFRDVPFDVVARDGARRHFLVSGLPIYSLETGAFRGVRGTAEDITQRRTAEEALRRREAVLEAVSYAAGAFLHAGDWREEMTAVIARVGGASQVDRIHVFQATSGPGGESVARVRFSWSATADPRHEVVCKDIPLDAYGFRSWSKRLTADNVIEGPVAGLPKGQRNFLSSEGVTSVLVVPIFSGDTWWGFLRFDRLTDEQAWIEAEIEAVKAAAGIIGGTIHRQRAEQTLRESEARFSTAFQTSPDAIIIARLGDGVFQEVNDGFTQLTGYSRRDIEGRSAVDLQLWGDSDVPRQAYRGLMKNGVVRDLQTTFRIKDGSIRSGSMSAKVIELNGEQCILSVIRDITGRKQADETIQKLSQAVEQSPSLVMITDLDGQIEYVNPRFRTITGYDPDEVIGRPATILDSDDAVTSVYEEIWQTIESGGEWQGEVSFRKKNGEDFLLAESISPIRSPEGEITHYVWLGEDITARKFYEERVLHQAHHDALTDLPNRNLFFDRVSQALARARRDGHSVALMFIDLDRFKLVNDSLGHSAGDRLLQETAERLSDCIGSTETVARLGSDEFAVILSDLADRHQAATMVSRVLEALSKPFYVGGKDVYVYGSVGIAAYPDDSPDQYTLLKNANTAMQRAKDLGGNTYQFFSPEMTAGAIEYLTMGGHLRHALERDEFELYYQPMVDIRSGHVVGAEALLRWFHPEMGMVPPANFIPLAEETGLIEPIGEWVLRSACMQNREWRDMGLAPLRIAVNVSSRQFQRRHLITSVTDAINDSGLPPSGLVLEITESAFLEDVLDTNTVLLELGRLGISISVDDFGTGYSSLSYLKRLPLSALKIDRSFVLDVTTNNDARAITQAIMAMAHSLNMTVVAEGVENAEQLDYLRGEGCEMMQGYYFSPPLSVADFTTMLQEGRRLAVSPDLFTSVDDN